MRGTWTLASLLFVWTCLGVACSNGRNSSASSAAAGTAAAAGVSGAAEVGAAGAGAGEPPESGAAGAAGAESGVDETPPPAAVGGSPAASAGAGGVEGPSGVRGADGASGAGAASDAAAGGSGDGAAGSSGMAASAAGGSGGVARGSTDAGSSGAGMRADGGRGGAAGTSPGGVRPGFPSLCDLPADCVRIETEAFRFDPCCRIGLACGYRLIEPADFAALFPLAAGSLDGCVPVESIFSKAEPHAEERIAVEGGEDILLTPACESRNLLAFPLWGCCKPSGVCGYSTDQTADILAGQSMSPDAGFSRYECATGSELNAQFRASPLAGLAHLPEVETRCDYPGIAARNPR